MACATDDWKRWAAESFWGLAEHCLRLESILKSHALIHTAEGEFFRNALVEACEHCGHSGVRSQGKGTLCGGVRRISGGR